MIGKIIVISTRQNMSNSDEVSEYDDNNIQLNSNSQNNYNDGDDYDDDDDDDEEETNLQLIYRNNEKEQVNINTKNMVKREVKKRIWPSLKFADLDSLKSQGLFEKGNVLHELLIGLNKAGNTNCEKARFWNTYVQDVIETLSVLKSTASNNVRISILKGMLLCLWEYDC